MSNEASVTIIIGLRSGDRLQIQAKNVSDGESIMKSLRDAMADDTIETTTVGRALVIRPFEIAFIAPAYILGIFGEEVPA